MFQFSDERDAKKNKKCISCKNIFTVDLTHASFHFSDAGKVPLDRLFCTVENVLKLLSWSHPLYQVFGHKLGKTTTQECPLYKPFLIKIDQGKKWTRIVQKRQNEVSKTDNK